MSPEHDTGGHAGSSEGMDSPQMSLFKDERSLVLLPIRWGRVGGDGVAGGTPVITLIEGSGAVREARLGLIETYCAVFLYAEYL